MNRFIPLASWIIGFIPSVSVGGLTWKGVLPSPWGWIGCVLLVPIVIPVAERVCRYWEGRVYRHSEESDL